MTKKSEKKAGGKKPAKKRAAAQGTIRDLDVKDGEKLKGGAMMAYAYLKGQKSS